ncbi:lipopolysaccharide assembly protein LapA domain-containing protein [Blastococcus saxobsidens]|uniref:Putative integral membrane protein n=1 Tax=Blastococcus saxobsidens TaxID=138336 RepID=A0A4Q7YBG2_9ACTN|nr:LapA family protein [Blastococcus saxobsidens]RZU33551.1 putative integral membrane protein [Blastococcus saxobsidens]
MSAPDQRPGGSPSDPLSVGLGGHRSDSPASGGPASTGPDPAGPTGPAQPDPATSKPPQQAPPRERHTGRAIGRTLALALLIFVTVLLVLFVVFNGQTVQISLVFTDVDAPLVLALLIAAVLGGLLVWLAGLVRRARRRNR